MSAHSKKIANSVGDFVTKVAGSVGGTAAGLLVYDEVKEPGRESKTNQGKPRQTWFRFRLVQVCIRKVIQSLQAF